MCCNYIPIIDFKVPSPKEVDDNIIKMLGSIGVVFLDYELESLENSLKKVARFMPINKSKSFFNVVVELDYYSIIIHLDLVVKTEEDLLKDRTRKMLISKGYTPNW